MKINSTVLAFGVLVGAGAIVGAYQLGQQGGASSDKQPETAVEKVATQSASNGQTTRSVDLFPEGQQTNGGPRFSHFRVGNRNVKSMYADGKYIWVGTSGGVIRYDMDTDDYQLYNNKNSGLLSNGIFHISRLGERMAIGTYGGGLALFTPETEEWKTYNIPHGLADQFVYDVVQAKNGDVWIATWSGANRIRNGEFENPDAWETFTVENTNGGLPNPWVYALDEGANGEIWLATEGGLARYQNGEWTKWGHDDGLGAPYEVVKEAIQFNSDPAKASMHHRRQKEEQGLQEVKNAYNPNYVISMAVEKDGTVWAGTWGAGLAKYDGKTWKNYTTIDGLPANHIFMLYLDEGGELWIGTSKGLVHFDQQQNRFDIKTVADGLYADNVFSMANGRNDSLWIGSFGGVAHIEHAWGK